MDQNGADQKLSDIPKTPSEARRRKGPVPLIAIIMAALLLLVWLLFFLPMFTGGS